MRKVTRMERIKKVRGVEENYWKNKIDPVIEESDGSNASIKAGQLVHY